MANLLASAATSARARTAARDAHLQDGFRLTLGAAQRRSLDGLLRKEGDDAEIGDQPPW